jgi:hypothetical protein
VLPEGRHRAKESKALLSQVSSGPRSDVPPPRAELDVHWLVADAVNSQPDLLATEQAAAAADERLRLQRLSICDLDIVTYSKNSPSTRHSPVSWATTTRTRAAGAFLPAAADS